MPIPLLLHGHHAEGPVAYEPFGPWIVPWTFGSFDDEYRSLRTGVGLLDGSTKALIEVRGADRASFLHNLLTQDLKRLAPGGGCPAALLTASARLVSDLFVLADQDAHWLLCEAPRAQTVVEALNRYVITEDVAITNHERRAALLVLEGPGAVEAAADACGADVSLSRPGDHTMRALEHMPVRLIRQSLCGGPGVWCLASAEDARELWNALQRIGRRFGLRPTGWEALNAARIEAGVPWFGIDMDETNLLPETGLETVAVSDTKGCYLGQEVIARLATYGSVSKRLVRLLVEGTRVPAAGDRIARDGEEVGRVTSACRSPALQRPIALGYLKRGADEPGTRVEILHGPTRLAATVTTRPLIQSVVDSP